MANVNNEFGKMWGFIGLAIAGVACAGVGALGILPNNLPVGIAVIVCGGLVLTYGIKQAIKLQNKA